MAVDTTYTNLRANLSNILDRVVDQQEVVIVRRKASRDVALIPASELASLTETAHLLRSPRNAQRLGRALRRAIEGKGNPVNIPELKQKMLDGS